MTDNKLKDNEIIKVLECCSKPVGENCKECPLHLTDCLKVSIEELALDLIDRLQAQNKDLAETVHNLTLEKDALFDKLEELKVKVERLNKEIQITKDAYTMLQTKIEIIKSEEVLLKYHPSKFYPFEISTPYGIFFCKKEEDYEEFKSKIQQDFIKYAKEYFKDNYFAYDAEQKCGELDDIFKGMENTIYDN